ncbi:MAG TPA: TldD/PmbA family protein [candidate division Zixibacteria bacterium]|nr:TldD/PmbA family protein [candidate division Zixibacteria bacterium]
MRTHEEIKQLLEKILAFAKPHTAQIHYSWDNSLATRFGENAITQNMSGESENVRIEIFNGLRKGSMVTNNLDNESMKKMIEIAVKMSKDAPEDPELMEILGQQEYPDTPKSFFDDVIQLTPEQVANDAKVVVEGAKAKGYKASGLFEVSANISAIANTKGLFCIEDSTNVSYSTTVHGPMGSGKGFANHSSYADLDIRKVADMALTNAEMAQNPADIEPEDYTVIFEPAAVAEMLGFLIWNMRARDADEGTTVFAGKLGQKMVSDKVNISVVIDDPEIPPAKFGEDGLPIKALPIFENGVLKNLRYDRFWAKNTGNEPVASIFPLAMKGEEQSVDDLVKKCKKGLLVKNLWYIRYVDRRELLLTGMTRDGVFLVEDGKIVGPVKNLRWNESPIVFLSNIVAMSRPERVDSNAKIPGIMSEGFTFSSKSESL